jgi:hypothetical protein
MLLWNWLMPAIFGLHTISFWQALGSGAEQDTVSAVSMAGTASADAGASA